MSCGDFTPKLCPNCATRMRAIKFTEREPLYNRIPIVNQFGNITGYSYDMIYVKHWFCKHCKYTEDESYRNTYKSFEFEIEETVLENGGVLR